MAGKVGDTLGSLEKAVARVADATEVSKGEEEYLHEMGIERGDDVNASGPLPLPHNFTFAFS